MGYVLYAMCHVACAKCQEGLPELGGGWVDYFAYGGLKAAEVGVTTTSTTADGAWTGRTFVMLDCAENKWQQQQQHEQHEQHEHGSNMSTAATPARATIQLAGGSGNGTTTAKKKQVACVI